MSLKLGNTPIAGISQNTKYNAHHLLDFKWTDCIMNDVSWLRADTFSWQSGDVYTSAYNHLVQDIQGITSETETIGSYTVTFYRATDGHKICLADQEQTVLNIYNSYGIAWYYILDTTNAQFKLPRTKYGFEGLRTNVGDKIDESLPNIRGKIIGDTFNATSSQGNPIYYTRNGALNAYSEGSSGKKASYQGSNAHNTQSVIYLNAHDANSTYQDNAPVQERATQMYLYFYVGDYSQTAIEQTAGLNAELFNGKADVNLANVNNQAKILMGGMAMPSGSYRTLSLGASGATYTAPANGYFYFYSSSVANSILNNTTKSYGSTVIGASGYVNHNLLFVNKNDVVQLVYSTNSGSSLKFIYAKGSESEAS